MALLTDMKNYIQKILYKFGSICYEQSLSHGLKQNYRLEYAFFFLYENTLNVKDYLR